MTFSLNKLNLDELYKIGMYEIVVLFIILFFTYTMPLTMYKFTNSFFGKIVSLSAIIYCAYQNIAYGIILAVIFIGISEIGYLERFTSEADTIKADTIKADTMSIEGMVVKPEIPNVKDKFISDHCGANKTNFDLETIEKDYTGLVFTDGICNPCDKSCRYTINNTSENLYLFDTKIKPQDSTHVESK